MNYRHAFHAGNFADVFERSLLTRILVYLTRKPAAMRYIDTHAGPGRYDLAGTEAERTGEWRDGVGRLLAAQLDGEFAALLAPYLKLIGPTDGSEPPKHYPGSPGIAQAMLRPQDRLILCELHPEDARHAQAEFGRDRRIKVIEIDGYTGLRAYVPPVERRGLVLIDPPFEVPDEFRRLEQDFLAAYGKWKTGVYALWYPLKVASAGAALGDRLMAGGVERLLRLELGVDAVSPDGPLAACGMLVVNPPFGLDQEARRLLPALAQILGKSGAAMQLVAGAGLG